MTAIRIIDSHLELANIGSNTHAQIDTGLTKLAGIESGATADQTKADIDGLGLSHGSLVDVSANDHHNELHSIASHNDTSATGAQLDTLTDNSIADALHRHSELVASDGSPDPVVCVDAAGNVGIGTASPSSPLDIVLGSAKGIRLRSVITDATIKDGRFLLGHYTNAEEDIAIFGAASYVGGTEVRFGGGFGIQNTATILKFITAADNTTLSGATRMTIESDGRVSIGMTPTTSALLALHSTTGALLLPRMITAQKNALTAINGMVVYDNTLNKFQGYENGAWTSLI